MPVNSLSTTPASLITPKPCALHALCSIHVLLHIIVSFQLAYYYKDRSPRRKKLRCSLNRTCVHLQIVEGAGRGAGEGERDRVETGGVVGGIGGGEEGEGGEGGGGRVEVEVRVEDLTTRMMMEM